MKTYRQGDVMLVRVRSIPEDAQVVECDGPLVLAHGEVTGHKHQFMDAENVRLYRAHDGARYLDVLGLSPLVHEEHSTIDVPKGKYFLPQQVEYTPAALRNVAD